MLVVPAIDLSLQDFTLSEEFAINWCEIIDNPSKCRPELVRLYTGSGADLVIDQLVEPNLWL